MSRRERPCEGRRKAMERILSAHGVKNTPSRCFRSHEMRHGDVVFRSRAGVGKARVDAKDYDTGTAQIRLQEFGDVQDYRFSRFRLTRSEAPDPLQARPRNWHPRFCGKFEFPASSVHWRVSSPAFLDSRSFPEAKNRNSGRAPSQSF